MGSFLVSKFKKSAKYIAHYYKELIGRTKRNESIGSINEWIVDNYYIINEQEKVINSELNSVEIRRINKRRKEYIYSLIYSYMRENDFKIDIPWLIKKLNKYQTENNSYFSYIEISFIYLLIKTILVSELASLSRVLGENLYQKDDVEYIFNKIRHDLNDNNELSLEDYISAKNLGEKSTYYIEQLNYHLKEEGQLFADLFSKFNEMLLENNQSLKEIIKDAHNELTRNNLLMINMITSLKAVVKYKTEYLYKSVSYAEKALISEEANIYDQLYENNKDEYRRKITKLSKEMRVSEYDYACCIVKKANEEKKHVGWYLFKPINTKLRFALYISSVIIFTLSLSFVIAYYLGIWLLPILLLPISNVVIEIINNILGRFVRTSSLFKLKFEEGLPKEYSTMVVIPTIVKDAKKVHSMFDRLETYYLSNKTDNLYFTLLGDAATEETKDADYDKEIVEAGLERVNFLNEKYGQKLFYFVYRNRLYSEGEECYLGFERKRGALSHFNKLLLHKLTKDDKNKYFKCHTFDNFDASIKYVITLDCDTKLVLNTALKLIGAMAHPLNRPVVSETKNAVISGYGIMQPKVSYDIEVTNKSLYSQLFVGLGGLDIYSTTYFDLYQDIFKEGSFVGKGIYDLEVFEHVLGSRFPNNLILSHDLLEGNYLRCGFINDVELFDDFPDNYLGDAKRHHRWNRGDWQIISWLKRKVRNEQNKTVENPLGALQKWKIFDNLRRSLINVCLLFILLYGFTFGAKDIFLYVSLVFTIIALPILFYLLSRVLTSSIYIGDPFLKYYLKLIRGFVAVVNKTLVVLAILPYEAYLYTDSTIRALYRMYISKKKLLNWIEAAEVAKTLKNSFDNYVKNFNINYLMTVILITCTYFLNSNNFTIAAVIAITWFFAPLLMYYLSKKIVRKKTDLNAAEKLEIKDIAIRTWNYFNDFLTEENNYLIPDNYQCNRGEKIDHKTSPTNIGFSLVSVISAFELDLIRIDRAMFLINNIVKTIEKLEKWYGHLYNWYNIYTTQELHPKFVSTVDNGNLITALYVTRSFLNKYGNADAIYRVNKLIEEMDFTRLYDSNSDTFSIGYVDSEQALSKFHYNNLASEARLTSFVAIAKGDVPYKHWFCLDRTLTKYKGYKGVTSWFGTAFEYFMPLIFMKTFDHTLLDESYYFAYHAQKEFMKEINSHLPWGISESACSELDDSENYKYKSFGIPYLKLQNSISYPIVISSYSSIMAIGIDDIEVYNNIQKLKKLEMYGNYGLFEAYDYEDKSVVKSLFAHHQGMILASITNYLKENVIRDYFHQNKKVSAIEMLLKEKVQLTTYIDLKSEKYKKYQYAKEVQENDVRERGYLSDIPEVGLLSNGSYALLINDRGVGFSKYRNLQINRYRSITTDDYGLFLYIRNLNNNNIWSNTYAPVKNDKVKYKVIFASDRIKYIAETPDGFITNTEITVVKDDYAELRKVTFINDTNSDITLEVTSYGEIIMARNEEDIAHRAFNSLTVESEFDKETSSLIYTRQSRTKENTKYYVIHRLFLENENDYLSYETSRLNFLGRNNDLSKPEVIVNKKALSNKTGAPIDPIMSMRKKFTVKARDKETLHMLVGFGKSREQVIEIAKNYYDRLTVNKAFSMTTIFNNMRNSYSGLKTFQMFMFYKILKHIYQVASMTEDRINLINNNKLSQSSLWNFGISGDISIIMVEISRIDNFDFVQKILQAYEFYKDRAIYVDVIIVNSEQVENVKPLTDLINNFIYRINSLNDFENLPGNVYVISRSKLNDDEFILLKSVAKLYFNASINISIEEQLDNLSSDLISYESMLPMKQNKKLLVDIPNELAFYNNFGGFINDGKEYYVATTNTPAPWINVITNSNFGFIISNNLGGYTYAHNSREYKLTAWSNDAVRDPRSEDIIINNVSFEPTYVKHGFGYSIFYGGNNDYDIYMKVFASSKESIKYYELVINNKTNNKQSIRIDLALNLVLGITEENTNRYLYCRFDEKDNCLYVKNKYNNYFKNLEVFVSSTEKIVDYIIDNPIYKKVSVEIDIVHKGTKKLVFMLGCGDSEYLKERKSFDIDDEYKEVVNYWREKLNTIQINTPDDSLNYMLNGWYLYQTYASRLLGKTGFYQVGGATGFRDQLQDIMSIIYSDEKYARNQIIEHAKHQFKDGSVLHWWHEELMFGSRTRVSDDYLWLVYVISEYIKITNDIDILKEEISYVDGPALSSSEGEKGIIYRHTDDKETLYNHLKRAIDLSTARVGSHGLPLMGSGDWNDGMNRVGNKGLGESVFVGLFLYDLLSKMSEIAKLENDNPYTEHCISKRDELSDNIRNNAWDGEWYLRAYYDNGVTLGSRNHSECQIDLLCQAWSVISGVAEGEKRDKLFKSVETKLVNKDEHFIQLLTPGFKNTHNNPGYIKNYAPGLRENAGQYTHAALWYILALLRDNQIEKAYEYYQMINPINRTSAKNDVLKYKVEPYVIAADIYTNKENIGRGGWTWYTGSASWAYKIGIEEILGFQKRGNTLTINPKINPEWDSYQITYKYYDTKYSITIINKHHVSTGIDNILLDNKEVKDNIIMLENDKKDHQVVVNMKEEL